MRYGWIKACWGLLVLVSACQCRPPVELPPPEPPKPEPWRPDAGKQEPEPPPPPVDAGVQLGDRWPGEKCPEGSFGPTDGGITFGLCVALRTLSGVARLDGKPLDDAMSLRWEAGDCESELDTLADSTGRYAGRVMRARYDVLEYHPSGIFPTHEGHQQMGPLDMTQDRTRDLDVRTHALRGTVSFAGVPWPGLFQPPDVQLSAVGFPQAQRVSATNQGGAYQVSFIEGQFAVGLSVPREALGETELAGYPIAPLVTLDKDVTLNVHLPSAELEGELLVDGRPFPDRKANGFDYQLEYVLSGQPEPSVVTHHEGGTPQLKAIVPRNKYAVRLRMESSPDRSLPSMLFNRQLASQIDLTQNAFARFQLSTFAIEGAILVDGVPVRPSPNYNWLLYAYGYPTQNAPWFLAYYEVPLTSAAFELRGLPGDYFVALWIDETFHPELVEGWYLVDDRYPLWADSKMPIDIATSRLEGKLLIDGQVPPTNASAGIVSFQAREGGWYRSRVTTGPDGSFSLRVPKGEYDVYFEIDDKTYPEHAVGMQRLVSRLYLLEDQRVALDYKTVRVSGPLRVGGQPVADTLAGHEVGLVMRRVLDGRTFRWTFNGGSPTYSLRVPEGEYALTFVIEKDAIPGVAGGFCPMGVRMGAK